MPVAGHTRAAEWQPVRMLKGPVSGWPSKTPIRTATATTGQLATRLTDAEFARWQQDFQAAWQEIERSTGPTPRRWPRG